MGWKLIIVFYVSVISSVCSKKYNKRDIYNDVYVTFPDDPCDDSRVEMPNFNAGRRLISEVKCLEYVWRVRYEQGKSVRRVQCQREDTGKTPIFGGSDASYGEYPHMVALGWRARVGTWVFKCGGSLISERFVLTAAHCSYIPSTDLTISESAPKIVRLGCKNIMDIDRGEPAYDINILRFISHHRYNSPRQYYDIALVELEDEVPFRWHVHPACLRNIFRNPNEGTVTGWGIVETGGLTASPELQKADIRIIDTDVCSQLLKDRGNNRTWWGLVWHQLCAGDSEGRIDTCRGDSGGPLQTLIPLRHSSTLVRWKLHEIVGVTSFGFGCARANTPGIYTRVASFVTWVEKVVWPQNRTLAYSNYD